MGRRLPSSTQRRYREVSKRNRVRAQRRSAPPPVGNKQRSDRIWWLAGGGILAAAIVALGVYALASGGTKPAKAVNESALVGLQSGPAPWKAEIAGLTDRLQALGLPALSSEGTVVHIHSHLDLFVNGKRVPVPGGLGINQGSQFISPLHTHDATGVIHVESTTKEHFTLGQVFAVWGVRFTPYQLGGYRGTPSRPVRLYAHGTRDENDPTRLVLAAHQEIAVVVGKAPARIPSSYRFPAGE
jgi:hypothetical protein